MDAAGIFAEPVNPEGRADPTAVTGHTRARRGGRADGGAAGARPAARSVARHGGRAGFRGLVAVQPPACSQQVQHGVDGLLP
jgi:hypothetical protein